MHEAVKILVLACVIRVKVYVIRAEDARLLGDMSSMRKMYTQLYSLNRKLIGDYAKRSNNHQVRGKIARGACGGLDQVCALECLRLCGAIDTFLSKCSDRTFCIYEGSDAHLSLSLVRPK